MYKFSKIGKKIPAWIVVFLVLIANLFGFFVPQKTKAAETRPADCYTKIGDITATATPKLKRCATTSPSGYTLHLWRGDETKVGTDEEFVFVGSPDYGTLGDIGKWIYRSTSDPNFYIAVKGDSNSISLTHHYRAGTETSWNQYATLTDTNDRDYWLVKSSTLPEYKNAVDSSGKRFVWRIVANGTVSLNGSPISGANIKVHLDQAGALLAEVNSNSDGSFEFSYKGTNKDIWINQGTVTKMKFYISFSKDGESYETTKSINIPGDWKAHSDSNTKLINLGSINLTSSNKVETLTEKPGGEQTALEEGGSSECEQKCKLVWYRRFSISNNIQAALCNVQCAIIDWEAEIVGIVVKSVLYPALGL